MVLLCFVTIIAFLFEVRTLFSWTVGITRRFGTIWTKYCHGRSSNWAPRAAHHIARAIGISCLVRRCEPFWCGGNQKTHSCATTRTKHRISSQTMASCTGAAGFDWNGEATPFGPNFNRMDEVSNIIEKQRGGCWILCDCLRGEDFPADYHILLLS